MCYKNYEIFVITHLLKMIIIFITLIKEQSSLLENVCEIGDYRKIYSTLMHSQKGNETETSKIFCYTFMNENILLPTCFKAQ